MNQIQNRKIPVEMTEIEVEYEQYKRSVKEGLLFFFKINKIDKPVARLTSKREDPNK